MNTVHFIIGIVIGLIISIIFTILSSKTISHELSALYKILIFVAPTVFIAVYYYIVIVL